MENNKKTIVLLSAFYKPFMSGAELFVKEVTERLANRHRFFIITAKLRADLPSKEDMDGYTLIRVGKGDKWDKLRYIWLAPREAKKYNPDIVHAVMESYAGLALWRAKKVIKGAKCILTLQSGDLDAKIWSKIPVLWKGIHRTPHQITAISNFLASRARRLGARNIKVIPNGADLSIAEKISLESRSDKSGHKIICLARLSWEKDHKNLIAAMPRILERYPDAKLILVGDGPLRASVEEQIKEKKLENNIELRGNLPHEEALRELAKADVSICPSLAEGLGITFIEAQATGVPVIGTRVGGIPDVIEHKETGLLIEPNSSSQIAEAIIEVFSMGTHERLEMISRAKESAKRKFDWNNIIEQVDIVYREPKKLNILVCTGIYPPASGGPATYSKLIEEKLNARGHKVRVLSYGDNDTKCYTVSKAGGPLLRYLSYFMRVLELGRKADLIYIQDSVSVGFPATLANLILKKKLILKVVGDYAWEMAQQTESLKKVSLDNFYPFKNEDYPVKIQLLEKIEKWVARRADKIITPSFYLKGILMGGWEMHSEKIKVIYNSFNVKESGIREQELGQEFKMLYVGRLVPWKGLDTMIDIVSELPEVRFEIIGDGPMKKQLELQASNPVLEDRVKLLGRLLHDEAIEKMKQSDLFILNTAYEGLSHVLLESFGSGLPVAASRRGGNTELVGESQERGYLFEYNNKSQIKEKIKYIIANQEEAKEKAKKAKEFVSGFSEEKMIDSLENNIK